MRRASARVALAASTGLALLAATFSAGTARADDFDTNITLAGGTGFFGAVHTDAFDFTDVFRFDVAGSVIANVSLVTIGSGANAIDFLEADLNGVALSLSPNGFLETGSLADTLLTGPLVLTVRGGSGAAGGTYASYSGTLNVAIVPEANVALMLGLGLGGLGLGARRARVG